MCESPLQALVSTGTGTWVWNSNLPDVLKVRWPDRAAAQDLRHIVDAEGWRLLLSQLQQAMLDEQAFHSQIWVSEGDSERYELQLMGGRSIDAGPAAKVRGLCWRADGRLHRDTQSQWAPLAKLSHELRSPLAAVVQQAGELLGRSEDSEMHEGLDSIRDSSTYMLRIIEDMLAAFRAGEPESVRAPESLLIDRLVGQIVPISASRARSKGLRLQVHKHADFPRRFWAEPVALRRILQNLLDNAVKYTTEGEILLSLSVSETDDGALLCFDVQDTGLGMSTDEITRVFEPFAQGSAGQIRSAGLGVGLALSRQLANSLDGDLTVDSDPGKGSRFRLAIPARVPVDDLNSGVQSVDGYDMTVVSPGKKVLLVDDHPLLSKLTERELIKLGCEVDVAATAREAISKVEQRVPDLVILDLELPDMSGCDLCRKLIARKDLAHCRFVAYSGSDQAADRHAAESAGFHAFHVKPVGAEVLIGD